MKTLLTILAVIVTIELHAQMGDVFPDMNAETLTNQFVNLPGDLKGKYSLICLASSKKAEEFLSPWFSPIYNNFIHKPDGQNFFGFTYDINVYFIPMITGVKRPAYKKTMEKTKKTVDPKIKPYVLFFEGSLKDYKDQLSLNDKNVPYFYVLDPEGKIIDATEGRYTQSKMQDVINAVAVSLKH